MSGAGQIEIVSGTVSVPDTGKRCFMAGSGMKLIANNKKAYYDYFIEDTYEAGISLHGTEVKSLRMGRCSVKEAFVRAENEDCLLYTSPSPRDRG